MIAPYNKNLSDIIKSPSTARQRVCTQWNIPTPISFVDTGEAYRPTRNTLTFQL